MLQSGHTQTFHCLPPPRNGCHTHSFTALMEGVRDHGTCLADFESSPSCPCLLLPLPSLSFSSYFSGPSSFLVLAECFSSSTQVWHLLTALPTVLYSSAAGFLQANKHNAFPGGLLINSASPLFLIRSNLANLGRRHFITN